MYPIEIKKTSYEIPFSEVFNDLINLIIKGLKSLHSPYQLIIFLYKSFHF